jgi:2-polyprenyl-3-methyl-5-hydroxy-6-metoxy-1,4-benzoquinol methylase
MLIRVGAALPHPAVAGLPPIRWRSLPVAHRQHDRQPARRSVRTAVVWEVLRAEIEAAAGRREGDAPGPGVLDVLDVGGGTGGFAVPLAQLGHRVTVVDPSPDALAALERRSAETGVTAQVTGIQGDVIGLSDVVEPGSADLVLCHGVLEYVEDPDGALAQVAAAVRPQGVLSLLAAQRHAAVLARALAGHFADARHGLDDPEGRWGHEDPVPRRYTEAELTELLAGAGFSLRSTHGVRIFADLVPGALVDSEPRGGEGLLELEHAAAEHPVFRALATQLHLLAVRR